MLITMLESRRASEDGKRVRFFEKGKQYDVADSLARQFLASVSAIRVHPKETPQEIVARLSKVPLVVDSRAVFRNMRGSL